MKIENKKEQKKNINENPFEMYFPIQASLGPEAPEANLYQSKYPNGTNLDSGNTYFLLITFIQEVLILVNKNFAITKLWLKMPLPVRALQREILPFSSQNLEEINGPLKCNAFHELLLFNFDVFQNFCYSLSFLSFKKRFLTWDFAHTKCGKDLAFKGANKGSNDFHFYQNIEKYYILFWHCNTFIHT